MTEEASDSNIISHEKVESIFEEFERKFEQIYRDNNVELSANQPLITTTEVEGVDTKIIALGFRNNIKWYQITLQNYKGRELRLLCLEASNQRSIFVYDDTPQKEGKISTIIESSIGKEGLADIEESIARKRKPDSNDFEDLMRDKWVKIAGDMYQTTQPLKEETVDLFTKALDTAVSKNTFEPSPKEATQLD